MEADAVRFVPSTEELLHWIHYGTQGCLCIICSQMRRLSDYPGVEDDSDPIDGHWRDITED